MCPEVQCDPVYAGKAQAEASDGAPPCTHDQPGSNVEQQPADPGTPPKEEPRAAPKGVPPPCYYPQPEDSMLAKEDTKDGGMLSRVGAWATGRVDWAPLAGLTGTRPVVDKYSITRYSEGEWRQRNYETLTKAEEEIHRNNLLEYNTKRCIEQTRVEADKNQFDNTKKLGQRAQELHRWKCELERAIAAAADEVSLLEAQRRRLKQASSVLSMPESIAKECLDRRTGRWEPDLVRDEVEEELIKEVALVAELRDLFNRTLQDIEHQLTEDKTAKQRLEFDWSDKKLAHEIDAINIGLNNRSNIIMFRPGSTRFAFDMSSQQHWEHFTREALEQGEATRQRSLMLRSTLDAILMNGARDLRTQADKVDAALSKKVTCTEELRAVLENNLQQVLQRLADTENFKVGLEALIRRLDTSMKIAQTRLDNRLLRPRVEGCRDAPQYGLIDEVKSLSEQVSALKAQMKQTEDSQTALKRARAGLEREIMLKRKALEIDRDRNQLIRSQYPSSAALSGH